MATDRADYRTALDVWLPGARDGDPEAMSNVGEIYEKGFGSTPDYEAAASWYRRAADKGYTRAMLSLGSLYESGFGVERNLKEAMYWYRLATGTDAVIAIDPVTSALRIPPSDGGSSKQVEAMQLELATLKREQAQLNAALITARAELAKHSDLQGSLDQLEHERSELRMQVTLLKSQLEKVRLDNKRTTDDAGRLSAELDSDLERIAMASRENASLLEALALAESAVVAVSSERNRLAAEIESARASSASDDAAQGRINELESALAAASLEAEEKKRTLERIAEQAQRQASELAEQQRRSESLEQQLVRAREEIAEGTRKQQKLSEALASAEADSELSGAQVEELQQKASRAEELDRILEITRSDLERVRAELSESLESKEGIESSLYATGAELEQARRSLGQREQALASLEKKLSDERAHVQERELRVSELERRLSLMTEEAAAREKALLTEAAAEAILAPPQITLIEPVLSPTRSVGELPSISSSQGRRVIVGKVDVPAGLIALNLNDIPVTSLKRGLFNQSIDLKTGVNPINIMAIDEQGKRSDLRFEFVFAPPGAAESGDADLKPETIVLPDVDFGSYHALVIGNNQYQYLPDLDSAINDASGLADVLKNHYGVDVTLIKDANRYEVLSALNDMRAKLTSEDNLLIYYAGHGYLDEVNMRGHWLPVDAESDNTANWISNVAITDILNVMAAKQVLVIADSCYSGAMTRSVQIRQGSNQTSDERLTWLRKMTSKRARVVLSSGGLQPVLDSGGGEHSVFTGALLEVLADNQDILDASTLHSLVAAKVSFAAATVGFDQEPEYAPLRHSGHESGDFFLVPKR